MHRQTRVSHETFWEVDMLKKRSRRIYRARANDHRVDELRNRPPLSALRERDEREIALARRTASQTLLGDPPEGYSALARRAAGKT
jgi:predicted component of type VI protein secretion system